MRRQIFEEILSLVHEKKSSGESARTSIPENIALVDRPEKLVKKFKSRFKTIIKLTLYGIS